MVINTQLQYYLGITDPDSLDDDEWATKFKILEKIRKDEQKTMQGLMSGTKR